MASDGRIKALDQLDGQPLLMRTLMSRPWVKNGSLSWSSLAFVLLDSERTREFAKRHLEEWFPGCQTCFISHVTSGAAMSALCGVAELADLDAPLCIDLADIVYDCAVNPVTDFGRYPDLGGIALTFNSSWPMYSYLEFSSSGEMIRAREKQVISDIASAGTYFFRSASVYLDSVSHLIRHRDILGYNDLLFVCPTLNGTAASGLRVEARPVINVIDVKSGAPQEKAADVITRNEPN